MNEPSTPLPADPPYDAPEREMLLNFIDYYRSVMLRKAEGLTREELALSVPPSTMTLAGMIKHLAYVEHEWFSYRLEGNEWTEPWGGVDWESDVDWDWNSAARDAWEDVASLYLREIDRSRDTVERFRDLDQPLARPDGDGKQVTLRWMLVHLVEEYARHAGHADLLRESIDGSVGD
ncbi:DinB family protein [Zhihengliuella salsuginis]|uniref:Mini-circle protein n=1 Tax=Zhihengliuella salsuginis TaxID=578222 RepID=A0ABQ3GDW7_9MICC|nr:DinB family protein [Zhihengliuella salsuginis]GHD01479.1 mini-circle protein [Zhihengliuella salsuginis]